MTRTSASNTIANGVRSAKSTSVGMGIPLVNGPPARTITQFGGLSKTGFGLAWTFIQQLDRRPGVV
jgi:hypothetical protein